MMQRTNPRAASFSDPSGNSMLLTAILPAFASANHAIRQLIAAPPKIRG